MPVHQPAVVRVSLLDSIAPHGGQQSSRAPMEGGKTTEPQPPASQGLALAGDSVHSRYHRRSRGGSDPIGSDAGPESEARPADATHPPAAETPNHGAHGDAGFRAHASPRQAHPLQHDSPTQTPGQPMEEQDHHHGPGLNTSTPPPPPRQQRTPAPPQSGPRLTGNYGAPIATPRRRLGEQSGEHAGEHAVREP